LPVKVLQQERASVRVATKRERGRDDPVIEELKENKTAVGIFWWFFERREGGVPTGQTRMDGEKIGGKQFQGGQVWNLGKGNAVGLFGRRTGKEKKKAPAETKAFGASEEAAQTGFCCGTQLQQNDKRKKGGEKGGHL